MSVKVIIFAYRKHGLSLEDFKTHYEAHIGLIKRLSGDDFPLSHQRNYVARTSVDTVPENASLLNALTPAVVLAGQQSDFDFDAVAILTFENEAALKAFTAKIYDPNAAAQLGEDEKKFLDHSRTSIAMLGDVIETTR